MDTVSPEALGPWFPDVCFAYPRFQVVIAFGRIEQIPRTFLLAASHRPHDCLNYQHNHSSAVLVENEQAICTKRRVGMVDNLNFQVCSPYPDWIASRDVSS